MTKSRDLNKNYATDLLWRIIDTYHNGSRRECAEKMLMTKQRLGYTLGHGNRITPQLAAKLRYFYPKEKFDWNMLMRYYDEEISQELDHA